MQYDFILIGEKHGIKDNFDTYLKLIKKFNYYENINVYFETSISAGIYINEYINGKEIFPLDVFGENYKGTMFGTEDFLNFIIRLKKYNQRTKRKVHFYGIDLEFQEKITNKMLEYLSDKQNNSLKNIIIENMKTTLKINKLNEEDFELQREELLAKNFIKTYKPKSLCYMGAWHTRLDSADRNFVKKILSEIKSLLSIELLYKNSKRTIKQNGEFKTVEVNDSFNGEDYKKYGEFYIMKNDNRQGVLLLENCLNTKMQSKS